MNLSMCIGVLKLEKRLSVELVSSFSVFLQAQGHDSPMKITSLSTKGEKIHADSALLFQRLIAVYSLEELSTAFGYEFSAKSVPLFDKVNLTNEADKPKLKHTLSKLLPKIVHVIPPNSKYVLDGGTLLHKVTWTVSHAFVQICQA